MSEMGVTQRYTPAFVQKHNQRRTAQPETAPANFHGRVPRLARLMALAIRFDHLLATGAVRDQAELAELGHVTRARVTQIMNLLHLAPDIQEEILSLPPVETGRDPVRERYIRDIAAEVSWPRQRQMWTMRIGRRPSPLAGNPSPISSCL